jgi:hypothetical protein
MANAEAAAEFEQQPCYDEEALEEHECTADEVAEQLLERLRTSLIDEPVASLAVLRSMLTHPDAADEVRGNAHVRGSNIGKAIHGVDGALRADVLSAVLIGVVLGRHLLKLEHLAEADPDRVVELLGPAIHSLTKD